MDKKLDKYLQTVAVELKGLNREKRAVELLEMRQHLEAVTERLQESGSSREEAIEAAMLQFGSPQSVGRALMKSHWTRVPLWRIVLAPVCALALDMAFYTIGMLLKNGLYGLLYGPEGGGWRGVSWFNPTQPLDFLFSFLLDTVGPFLAGCLSARIAGRSALWSVGVVYALLVILTSGAPGDHFVWVCMGAFLTAYGNRQQPKMKRA